MTTITPSSLFVLGDFNGTLGDPVVVTRSWKDRLAGTAFVGPDPMEGFVAAIGMDGPVVVGVADIAADGTWEITDIPERYDGVDLLVIGIPRTSSESYATASRIRTV